MALLGHHFSDVTTAPWTSRLRRLWIAKNRQPALLQFKHINSRNTDAAACKTATEVYAGQMNLTAEEFSSLVWLDVFARSGRQLLMCHALRLLQGWNNLRHAAASVEVATLVLDRLTTAAPDFAFHLPPALLGPLAEATHRQIQRVQTAKANSAVKVLAKAQSLLRCSYVVQSGAALQHEALHLLDQSVPHLVLADGGPSTHSLPAYVQWISQLLASQHLNFAPHTRCALDRAAPFLSMLQCADSSYCFDSTLKPVPCVADTPPLHIARQSSVGHAHAGKTVVIAAGQGHGGASQLFISSQGQRLCEASMLTATQHATSICDFHQTPQGQLFQLNATDFSRAVFLSPNGDDVRIEEQLHGTPQDQVIRFTVNREAKVSVARNGTQATIALGHKNLWQLTVRGAVLQRQADDHSFHIVAMAQNVNWALKRINRSSSRGNKPELPELPF